MLPLPLAQLPERLGKAGVMQLKCTLAGGKHLQVAGPPASGSSSRILLEGELHAAVHSFEDGSVWDVVSEGEGQVGSGRLRNGDGVLQCMPLGCLTNANCGTSYPSSGRQCCAALVQTATGIRCQRLLMPCTLVC